MRKIIVLTFLTLDGIMQAPGGPEEDTSSDFKYGGWSFPYFDDFMGGVMSEQMGRPFDLLLGRKTYDIFASFWPNQDDANLGAAPLNKATKYVVSKTLTNPTWDKTIVIKDNIAEELKKLKQTDGPDLQVHGSGNLIQTLLKHDLVDELWLKIFPVLLGKGKRLFGEEIMPGAWKLIESKTSPNGVIIANYKREGEIRTGSFA